jgi:hypothetical protein
MLFVLMFEWYGIKSSVVIKSKKSNNTPELTVFRIRDLDPDPVRSVDQYPDPEPGGQE